MVRSGLFTGGCLCGAVRYEAGGEPLFSLLCHCKMCQRASGAPVSALLFMDTDNVKLTKGQTRTVRFSPRTHRDLCNACGSPLFFRRDDWPEGRAIYVGSLDDPSGFRPGLHVCVSSAMAWLEIRDDAPRYEEKPEDWGQTLQYDPISGHAKVSE